jgi:hypothetical protein
MDKETILKFSYYAFCIGVMIGAFIMLLTLSKK